MRFAQTDGSMIDVYQADDPDDRRVRPDATRSRSTRCSTARSARRATTARSPPTCTRTRATRRRGRAADIVASAQARGVPVVSAKQMLTWLDGRNASTFGAPTWNGQDLAFSVVQGLGARNLRALLPASAGTRTLAALTRGGAPVAVQRRDDRRRELRGVRRRQRQLRRDLPRGPDTTPPVLSALAATPGESGTEQIHVDQRRARDLARRVRHEPGEPHPVGLLGRARHVPPADAVRSPGGDHDLLPGHVLRRVGQLRDRAGAARRSRELRDQCRRVSARRAAGRLRRRRERGHGDGRRRPPGRGPRRAVRRAAPGRTGASLRGRAAARPAVAGGAPHRGRRARRPARELRAGHHARVQRDLQRRRLPARRLQRRLQRAPGRSSARAAAARCWRARTTARVDRHPPRHRAGHATPVPDRVGRRAGAVLRRRRAGRHARDLDRGRRCARW